MLAILSTRASVEDSLAVYVMSCWLYLAQELVLKVLAGNHRRRAYPGIAKCSVAKSCPGTHTALQVPMLAIITVQLFSLINPYE